MVSLDRYDGPAEESAGYFSFADTFVFRDESDPELFHYLPLFPAPRLTAAGKPSGQLIAAGEASFLMLAVIWDLEPEREEELRDQIAAALAEDAGEHASAEDAVPVRLSFAAVSGVHAELRTSGADGRALGESGTSGMPPYAAMFNLSLAGEDREAAIAACNGREGQLLASYTAMLRAPVTVSAQLEGELSQITDEASFDRALEDGRVTMTMSSNASAFASQLRQRALEVLRLASPGSGRGQVTVELGFEEPVKIQAIADVGRWFSDDPVVLPAA